MTGRTKDSKGIKSVRRRIINNIWRNTQINYHTHIIIINVSIGERLGYYRYDNNIDYYIASLKCEVLTHQNKIKIHNTSSIYINIEHLLPTIKEAWGCKESDITKISNNEYHIKYDIEILNKYEKFIFSKNWSTYRLENFTLVLSRYIWILFTA